MADWWFTMDKEKPGPSSLSLWENDVPGDQAGDGFRPWMDFYPVPGSRRGLVLICPGGGYGSRMPHEGIMVAKRFNEFGIPAAVVHYRIAPHRHPEPMMDLSRALRIARSKASEWNICPAHVAVCGFSAGGHLAASLGLLWHEYPFTHEDSMAAISNRPDAMIPCYPVITSGEEGHNGSFLNLLGPDGPASPLWQALSLEHRVTDKAVPAFIWQSSEDSPHNGMALASALMQHKLPFEIHIFEKGEHGLAVTDDPPCNAWLPLCVEWLKTRGW